MLSSIELTNYRGHTHTTVPLARFTLLVGDNASGKTSVLHALVLLARKLLPTLEPMAERDFKVLRRHGAHADVELAVRGMELSEWSFSLRFREESSGRTSVRYACEVGDQTREEPVENLPALLQQTPDFAPLRRLAPPPSILRLDAAALAEPSFSDDEVPTLADDGAGLATVLKHLKATDDEAYKTLLDAARAVVPLLKDLTFQRVRRSATQSRLMALNGQPVTVPERVSVIADELLLKFTDTDWLPAYAASEGTLLTLGVLTRLYTRPAPRVILLDDLDRALHPRAQGELVGVLRAALDRAPDVQVIATAHSPYLVDHFDADSVVVLGRSDDGRVVARRLSDHPDGRLRAAMTTGEFLTASGWYWG